MLLLTVTDMVSCFCTGCVEVFHWKVFSQLIGFDVPHGCFSANIYPMQGHHIHQIGHWHDKDPPWAMVKELAWTPPAQQEMLCYSGGVYPVDPCKTFHLIAAYDGDGPN